MPRDTKTFLTPHRSRHERYTRARRRSQQTSREDHSNLQQARTAAQNLAKCALLGAGSRRLRFTTNCPCTFCVDPSTCDETVCVGESGVCRRRQDARSRAFSCFAHLGPVCRHVGGLCGLVTSLRGVPQVSGGGESKTCGGISHNSHIGDGVAVRR